METVSTICGPATRRSDRPSKPTERLEQAQRDGYFRLMAASCSNVAKPEKRKRDEDARVKFPTQTDSTHQPKRVRLNLTQSSTEDESERETRVYPTETVGFLPCASPPPENHREEMIESHYWGLLTAADYQRWKNQWVKQGGASSHGGWAVAAREGWLGPEASHRLNLIEGAGVKGSEERQRLVFRRLAERDAKEKHDREEALLRIQRDKKKKARENAFWASKEAAETAMWEKAQTQKAAREYERQKMAEEAESDLRSFPWEELPMESRALTLRIPEAFPMYAQDIKREQDRQRAVAGGAQRSIKSLNKRLNEWTREKRAQNYGNSK